MEEKQIITTPKAGKGRAIALVALLVLCALILNLLCALIPGRYRKLDVSGQGYYSLSDDTKTFLSTIDEDVTLYMILDGERDTRFEYFVESVADQSRRVTLERLDLEKSGAILEKVGMTVDQLTDLNIGYLLLVESAARVELVDYASLFYYQTENTSLTQLGISQMSLSDYSNYVNYFYQLSAEDENYATYLDILLYDTFMYFQGESVLASMLEYVTADIIPVNYALSGHGEADYESSLLGNMLSTYGSSCQVLDLTQQGEIPADAANVFVIAPTSDYSPAEIDAMKAYLERGGQMIFVTGETNLAMPNLMSLMADYGLSATGGAVREEITKDAAEEGEGEGEGESEGETEETEPVTEWVDSVSVTVNTQHDSMAMGATESTLAPVITGGNSIQFSATDDPSLIHTALLTTSENAAVGEDTENKGTHTLAAAAEKANGAHLLWFTGAESFAVTRAQALANQSLIYNNFCLYMAMNWTNVRYESALSLPDAIRYDDDPLIAENAQITVFAIVTILAIPAALIVSGVVIGYKRKKA